MKVEGTEAINAPRDEVFTLITDPAVLERSVPGCESLKTTAKDSYDIILKAGVGSIKGSFAGTIRVENVEAPRHLRMIVDVKGKVGFVKGAGKIDLAESEESAESTLVTYSGDVNIGGVIASVGQRMVLSAAKMMTSRFFSAISEEATRTAGSEV
jgi:carbon monoxide dehydrogenase subunit G